MNKDYTDLVSNYIEQEIDIMRKLDVNQISLVMNVLEQARLREAAIYICGNGGSASTASHFAGDFNKGVSERLDQKYRFVCLNDNIPSVLAIANDIGYDRVYDMQLENRITESDILIAISGSGNSPNIVNAVRYAKKTGAAVIGITGYDGGEVFRLSDINLHVPIDNMQITEDVHMMFEHVMMWILAYGGNYA